MPLPTKKTQPVLSLANTTIHIYGPGKIGKSTFCSEAPEPYFIATEQTLDGLEIYVDYVNTWLEFLEKCAEVAAGGHPYKTIVIDTMDGLYKMCADHICKKHGFKHEGDPGYGLGYALIRNELERALKKLSFLPYGLIFVSHVDEREIDTRTGKRKRMMPPYPRKTQDMLEYMSYFTLFCDYETVADEETGMERTVHVLRTKPHPNYSAGDRFNILPETMELRWNAFLDAFTAGAKRYAEAEKKAEKKETATSSGGSQKTQQAGQTTTASTGAVGTQTSQTTGKAASK